jgi:uncharacterized protein YjbJ (UPF0337 family)
VSRVTVPSPGSGKIRLTAGTSFIGGVHVGRQEPGPRDRGLTDRIKGTGNVVGGRARGAYGGAAGDLGEQVKGKAQEIKGKVQQAIGKAKRRSNDDDTQD